MSPLEDTKRSQGKKRSSPIPLEVLFRPGVRGTYDFYEAELSDEDQCVRFGFKADFGATSIEEDAWLMRNDFLQQDFELNPGPDGMTLTYGRFGVGMDDLSVAGDRLGLKYTMLDAVRTFASEYREWQSFFRAAMVTKMKDWPNLASLYSEQKVERLCRPMELAIRWRGGKPVGVIECSGVLQALFATLQVDALAEAEYRFCSCVGCRKSFKVKRRDQRYCDDRCKHRQTVRDGRDKLRALAGKLQIAEGN